MGDVESRFRRDPRCEVIPLAWWKGIDLAGWVRDRKAKYKRVALLVHSFGGIPTLNAIAAGVFDNDDFVALIDPVGDKFGVSTYTLIKPAPGYMPRLEWIRRQGFDVEVPLDIIGLPGPNTSYAGAHNSLPHNPQLIEDLYTLAVKGIV